MKALVVGFSAEDTRTLSQELRAAGHHVLGAVGKQSAWTFLRAVAPDVVVVPAGPDGERARGWVRELGVEVPFVELGLGADAVSLLGRFAHGEPLAPPAPPPAQAPVPVPVPVPVPEQTGRPQAPPLQRSDAPAPAPPPAQAPVPVPVPVPAPEPEPEQTGRPQGPPLQRSDAPAPAPPSRRLPRPPRPEAEPEVREPHPDLVSKLAHVRFGDYHSILEVEPQASPYAVREQHERLARRFSPRGWPARLSPDEIDMLHEVSRGIADAFLVLSDPELAVRYERALGKAAQAASAGLPTARAVASNDPSTR